MNEFEALKEMYAELNDSKRWSNNFMSISKSLKLGQLYKELSEYYKNHYDKTLSKWKTVKEMQEYYEKLLEQIKELEK